LALCRNNGEIALFTKLYSQAYPVKVDFNKCELQLAMAQKMPSDWLMDFRKHLLNWTGKEWQFKPLQLKDLQDKGDTEILTIHELDTRKHMELRQNIEAHPAMKKIVDKWPDISIIDIKNID